MTRFEVFDGGKYVVIPGVPGPQAFAQVSATPPTPRGVGDVWVNDTTPLLAGWDDGWRYPVLLNGWVDYNAGVYGTARYRRTPSGLVVCQGLIKSGTLGNTAAPAFYLDEGCRPSVSNNAITFPVMSNGVGRALLYPDGRFIAYRGSTGWFSLACSWWAA